MGTREITLSVNDAPIELDYFVQRYIDHLTGGILAALEGTGEIQTVTLAIDKDKDAVEINLNDAVVPVKTFVTKIIRNTVFGMVSSLKGVSEINTVKIDIKR